MVALAGNTPPADAPKLVGNSTYISVEANEHGIRNRIDVYGPNFVSRAIGKSPNTGAGQHEGGLIWIQPHDAFYRLANIGIDLPKEGAKEWIFEGIKCERLDINADVYSSVCSRGDTRFYTLVSKAKGVLSFTGFCRVMKGNLCQYVLTTEKGIAHR